MRMSFFADGELLKGAERVTRKPQVLRTLDLLTGQIPANCRAGRDLSVHYAAQFTRLKRAGTPIGANDLWIVCHALAEDTILVTNNTREFDRVAGLAVENGSR